MKLSTILCVLWVGGWVLGALLVIAASLMRCRKCGKWHEESEQERKCNDEN